MNLHIRDIDPETRGLLYRLQAEKGFPNLKETIAFLVKEYYKSNNLSTSTQIEKNSGK